MTVSIRRVTAADLDALLAISIDTFNESYRHLNDPADFDAYLQSAFHPDQLHKELAAPNTRFFFAEQVDGEVLGYIKVNLHHPPQAAKGAVIQQPLDSDRPADWTELERIYVRQSAQGLRIGALLMQTALESTQSAGCRYCWLGVWEINHKAIAFYQHFGFQAFGTHIFDIGNDPQTDVLMYLGVHD